MLSSILPLPPHESMIRHVCKALSLYWPKNSSLLIASSLASTKSVTVSGPLKLISITLPDWAFDHGVDGALLVPAEACYRGDDWLQVDWWLAAFILLECWHERTWELNYGPIHSYSSRLKGWDTRAWEYAWVNRIALFMRSWVARDKATTTNELFGPLQCAELLMTHDVDAICKTLPIRLKQCAFNLLNAGRHLARAEIRTAMRKLSCASRFLFSHDDWWSFDSLIEQEKRMGIQAHFNFYADTRRKTLLRWLFDPGYDIRDKRIQELTQKIQELNGVVGLHPSFDSCASAEIIRQQRERLVKIANQPVTTCRQHWLRFSWKHTWAAQEDAGIEHDTTLMFNDRPGYRASAALAWQPWNQNLQRMHCLTAQPTVIMDSHLYDYQSFDTAKRKTAMSRWIEETRAVNGQIAVLWHPHTLTEDYSWTEGFQDLLNILRDTTPCPHSR